MTKPGILIVFSGPSGVGKDTVLRRFMEQQPNCSLSISATTRAPRAGETDGVDYSFMNRERFGELVARGEMLEYAQYSGNLYGTPRETVERQLAAGQHVILEIEVQGAMQVKKLRPDALFVFLMPPSWESLRLRLEKRGTETRESLQARLETARREMDGAGGYDYILINDDLGRCVETFQAVVCAAEHSVTHMQEFIKEVISHA